ncbi:DUF6053 domain-containing protein [Lysobacter enzymogenes]|uniref:DUF6053 domain-containing protein n=1 Tax=Lysobacter enzymogenes TaxID=69 RepID=UPI003CCCC85F
MIGDDRRAHIGAGGRGGIGHVSAAPRRGGAGSGEGRGSGGSDEAWRHYRPGQGGGSWRRAAGWNESVGPEGPPTAANAARDPQAMTFCRRPQAYVGGLRLV